MATEAHLPPALMEYHCTKATDVATRIFERGLDTFPDEVEYALRYLGFLISINDDSSEWRLQVLVIDANALAVIRRPRPVRAHCE